jgi:hypothetical protein
MIVGFGEGVQVLTPLESFSLNEFGEIFLFFVREMDPPKSEVNRDCPSEGIRITRSHGLESGTSIVLSHCVNRKRNSQSVED